MSAVYNDQNDPTASIEAKKLADEIIASQATDKANGLDIKLKLENLDAVEMQQLLGILHETFDGVDTHSVDDLNPALIQILKEKLGDLAEKIKNVRIYMYLSFV